MLTVARLFIVLVWAGLVRSDVSHTGLAWTITQTQLCRAWPSLHPRHHSPPLPLTALAVVLCLKTDIYLSTARKQPTPPFSVGACVVAVFPRDVTNIIDIWVQHQQGPVAGSCNNIPLSYVPHSAGELHYSQSHVKRSSLGRELRGSLSAASLSLEDNFQLSMSSFLTRHHLWWRNPYRQHAKVCVES